MRTLLASSLLLACAVAADAPWQNLFEIRTLKLPGDSWSIDNGTIKSMPKPVISEDLFSAKEYEDFELEFEWKLSPGANSGVKYRLQEAIFMNESISRPVKKFEETVRDEIVRRPSKRENLKPGERGQLYTVAFEFQLIDDDNYKGGLKDDQKTGSLYSFVAPSKPAAKKPGEWNSAKLIVKGDQAEHWVNGVKVLDASLKGATIATGANKRWGADHPVAKMLIEQPKKKSPILLTNHGDAAWFRNLRIRPL